MAMGERRRTRPVAMGAGSARRESLVGRRGAVVRIAGRGLALEHLGPDPVDRLVQDSPQVAQCVLADRLGLPGRRAQFPAELLGQPFQVTVGVRVGPAVPGRTRPAAPAGPAGPLAPLALAPAAGPVAGFLVWC